MKILSWSKDLILNAAVCFSGTHAVVRIAKETVVTSGSRVKRVLSWAMSKWRTSLWPSMQRRMKTFSWRKDLKLNASWCFSGTHATVRFTKEIFVTSGSRLKRVFTWALSRWRDTVTLNEEKDEDVVVEEGPQIERGTVTHAPVRFITETSVKSGSCVKRVLT